MTEAINGMYRLIDDLNALCDDSTPIFPGKVVVNHKELIKIAEALPNSVGEAVENARIILQNKDDIIQEARMRAERIIQDAENERYKLLNESSLNKAMEEHAEKFKQAVFEECQQIKMQALNEAQETKLNSKNEATHMREESQKYAQEILGQLEQVLNNLYQTVMNGQQRLQDIRSSESIQNINNNHQ